MLGNETTHIKSTNKLYPPLTMLVINRSLHVINRSMRHPRTIQNLQPLLRRLGPGDVLDHAFEQLAMLDSQRVGQEALVGGPFGLAEALAHNEEEPVVAAAYHEIAVGGLEAAVGDDGGF